MLLLLLLLINLPRFSPMVIDFSSISWIFSDGRRFFMNFHRFPLIFINFQLRSLPPHSFPAEISDSPFISSWDPCLPIHFQLRSLPPARGAVRDPLQEPIPEQIPVLGAKCMKNHTNSLVFVVFGAKTQECLQFFQNNDDIHSPNSNLLAVL